MILINLETLSNALKTARRKKAKVRHQEGEIYLVTCENPEHKEPHAVFFEQRRAGLFGACDCPSRRACYHLVHAANLREHVREVQFQAAMSNLTADWKKSEGILQHVGTGKPAERVRGMRI